MTHHQPHLTKFAISLISSCLLAACGGGGGGSSGSSDQVTPTTFPTSSAVSTFYSKAQSFSLSATHSSGVKYALSYQISAPVATTSPSSGYAYTNGNSKVGIQATISASGSTVSTQTFTRYIRTSPFSYSYLQKGSGPYTLYTALAELPSSSTSFSSTQMASGRVFATTPGCQASGLFNCYAGDTSLRASLTPIDQASAWLCFTSSDSISDLYRASAQEECLRIDASGTTLGLRVTFTVSGQLLQFQ